MALAVAEFPSHMSGRNVWDKESRLSFFHCNLFDDCGILNSGTFILGGG